MTQLAIQVRLYPHRSMRKQADSQQFSWHTPAAIRVRLRKNGKNVDLVTGPDGTVSGKVPAGRHDLSLRTLSGFTIKPGRVRVRGKNQTLTLEVFPGKGYWLVPLRLQAPPSAQPTVAGVAGAKVRLSRPGKRYTSLSDGSVYGACKEGNVQVKPQKIGSFAPVQPNFVVRSGEPQEQIPVEYQPRPARITIRAELDPFGPENAISGVTFEVTRPGQDVPLRQVTRGSQACVFSDLPPGQVTIRVVPPAEYGGTPITLLGGKDEMTISLAAGADQDLSSYFRFKYATGSLRGRVVDSDGTPVSDVPLVARSNGLAKTVKSDGKGRYTLRELRVGTWSVMLDQSAVPVDGRTLTADPDLSAIAVQIQAGQMANAGSFSLEEDEHGVRGQVQDDSGEPVPYAIVEIRDQHMTVIDTVVADAQGNYSWKSPSSGMFVVSLLRQDGVTVQRRTVTVNSWTVANLTSSDGSGGPATQGSGPSAVRDEPVTTTSQTGHIPREAIIDLSSYPVLTEEVSTTGVPAPSDGGAGGGARATGYGQAVDQAIRDVLGWRPSGDVAGFQAALAGAFQLSEVEGHTQWSWQQRGYAVQADMGALTGAQASIYARAKSALDQILPLLAGLTTLNPALYQPQDLEAIRTVITAELQALVGELALEGGPRIQRVDELFRLLLGEGHKSLGMNPDLIQGHLGTLRDRFGLTVSEIDTVDEERIVTNFRIIAEQVLALQASWYSDSALLSGVNSRTALGTILIWLSRGLEAVCESVGDVMFALDSVYVDAAQRQIIELRFADVTLTVPGLPLRANQTMPYTFGHHEAPLLLSDLLDWVLRSSRDEGPRIIQDAGKDGVLAFAPVLDKLRILIHATVKVVHSQATLPSGMRTPRVDRALKVLAGQLDEAADLARLARRDQAPQITSAVTGPPTLMPSSQVPQITVTMAGNNLRKHASVVLIPENREDLVDLHGRGLAVTSPSAATATFRDPKSVPNAAGVNWLLLFTNEDGAQSYPNALTFTS